MDKVKKMKIISTYKSALQSAKNAMSVFLGPQKLIEEVPYKLAYILAQYKLPFSVCGAFMDFAKVADPGSEVFHKATGSRRTVVRRMEDIYEKVIKPEVQGAANDALCWSYAIDESMDKGSVEQLGIFIRFINIPKEQVAVKFLAYEPVKGSPNAQNLFECFDRAVTAAKLPKQKCIGHTSDNAKVVISELNGVAAKVRDAYNASLYIQHCVTHTEVLVAKDAQKIMPSWVEKTVKDIMDHFYFSAVRKHKFLEIQAASDKCRNIVRYHRVRWLSLQSCVDRIVENLQPLAQYFDEESHSMAIKKSDRTNCAKLYETISNPEFLLYLYFLQGQLSQLADINIELQASKQTLFATYRRMFQFMRVYVSPVLCDDTLDLKTLLEHENIISIDNHDMQDPPPFGEQAFHDYWIECIDNGHLPSRKLKEIFNNCFQYIVTIGRSFLRRFPEAGFVLNNCSFMDPERRTMKLDKCVAAVVKRFKDCVPDERSVMRSYKLYQLDDSLDILYRNECDKDPVNFFCKVHGMRELAPFAEVCITLLTVQPDVCDLERGFSHMNKIKNQYRACMTQEHLNAAVGISHDERSVFSFPFDKCIK